MANLGAGPNERGVVGLADSDPNMLGKIGIFEDVDPATPVKLRSQSLCYGRWMKNSDTTACVPKRLVSHKAAARGKEFDDYTGQYDVETAGVIDEFLPAGGVATTQCCWVFFKGPHTLTSDGNTTLAQGNRLCPAATGYVDIQVAAPADATAAMIQVNSTVAIATEAATNVAGTEFLAHLIIADA